MLNITKARHSTPKQEEFAQQIHDDLGIELPKVFTFAAYSAWLDKHVPEYRRWLYERQLEHELDMESIDARRDW